MRLLIIEDDTELATLLGRYLERHGFLVTAVRDGEDGILAFTRADVDVFDVVLTGGLLPRKNGYEVCTAIRALPHGKKPGLVLMSAAFRGAAARNHAFSTGADAYFTKPFVLNELREKLRELGARAKGIPVPTDAPASPASTPPTPAASKGTSSRPPTPVFEERAPAEKPRKLEATEVKTPTDVAAVLLLAARERFDGVLRFADGENELKVAYMRGIVVGAGDNLREHALGEWLRRQGRLTDAQARALDDRLSQTRERVAEALLALGFVTATEALGLVDLQVHARVRRALVWKGKVDLVEGEDAAEPLAAHALDVVEVLLRFALEPSHRKEADAFAVTRASELLERTADFDSGLVGFARLRRMSSLPQLLLERVSTIGEVAAIADAVEIWALWFAGLLRAQLDPPADPRSVPRAVKTSRGTGGLVDDDAVAAVARVLLKARRASVYQLLDVPHTTPTAAVLEGLHALEAAVGRDTLKNTNLGPAGSSARELWTLLEEHNFVFSDERRRKTYDADLGHIVVPLLPSVRPPTPTRTLLEVQMLVDSGALADAASMLGEFSVANPDDIEAMALRGHLAVLMGERDRGVALLYDAARRHPQAVRPLYYLGLLALIDGDKDQARQMLTECARRAPRDADVQRALKSI